MALIVASLGVGYIAPSASAQDAAPQLPELRCPISSEQLETEQAKAATSLEKLGYPPGSVDNYKARVASRPECERRRILLRFYRRVVSLAEGR